MTARIEPIVMEPNSTIACGRRADPAPESDDRRRTRGMVPSFDVSAMLGSLTMPGVVFAAGAAVYLALCALAFFVFRPTTLVYFADYWEHRAIVSEVIRHGTRLLDPIYGEAASSRQFTPWSLALGGFARLFGVSADAALAAGAMVVSVLFVIGIHAFARAYYARPWAPAILLGAVTCAWGLPPLIWTGFPSLRSQLHGNYYPSALVFSLTFIAWAHTLRLLRASRLGGTEAACALLLAATVAVALITHPLNAVFLLAGAGALAMLEPGIAVRIRAGTMAVLMAAVVVSTLWPYFNPLSLAGAGLARGQATFNNFDLFFDPLFVVGLMWPAGFALVAWRRQLRDRATRLPVIAFLAVSVAYVVGGIADVSVSHRLLSFMALALQLMLVEVMLDVIAKRPPGALAGVTAKGWRVAGWLTAAIVALQIVLAADQLVQPWAAQPGNTHLHDVDAETRRVGAMLPRDARVLGWDSAALAIAAYGTKVVALPRPMPLSPSDPKRQIDVRRFFHLNTPDCERRDIAARWGATHIVYLSEEVRGRLQRQLQTTLGPATSVGPWRIIAVPARCRSSRS